MSIWLEGMDWREEPPPAAFGDFLGDEEYTRRLRLRLDEDSLKKEGGASMNKTLEESVKPDVSPDGMIFERISNLKPGDTFWVSETIGRKDYLTPRIVVDVEYEREDETRLFVLFRDDVEGKFYYHEKGEFVLVDGALGEVV